MQQCRNLSAVAGDGRMQGVQDERKREEHIMRQDKKFIRFLLLPVLALLALGGCGKGQGSAESDTEQLMAYKDLRYLPEFTDTSEEYRASATQGIGFVNDTFYLIEWEMIRAEYGDTRGTGRLIARNIGTGDEKVLLDDKDLGAGIREASLLKDGSVIVGLRTQDGYRLCRVDPEGTEIFSSDCAEASEDWFGFRLAADSQGRSYIVLQDEIFLYDEQGRASGKVDLKGKTASKIACSGSGTVYIYDWTAGQLIPIDFAAASLGAEACPMLTGLQAIGMASDTDFYICDSTTVYEYNCGDGALTPLFDLQDSQIYGAGNIQAMGEMSDGRFFLFSNDCAEVTEMALLSPTPLEECPVKTVVTIGTANAGSNLLESVANFNRRNQAFSVSVLNYGVGGRSYQEALAALKLDISIGKGPDMCELDGLDEPEALFAGGFFTDLSDYLENSAQYSKEDFVAQALEAYTCEGQLMAIPQYFYMDTIVGKPDIVGDGMGWDMEDLKAVIQEYPEALVFANRPATDMLQVLLRNGIDEFLDVDSGKASFDSGAYIDLLNFVNSLPDRYRESEQGIYGNEWLREGKALLWLGYINSTDALQEISFRFGGEYTCIGYPAPDRKPDCIISGCDAYAICAASSNQDMAWEFLEWFYAGQGEKKEWAYLSSGLPTRKAVMERELAEGVKERKAWDGMSMMYEDGSHIEFRTADPEEVELIYTLLECASPEKATERTVLEIIEEEAAYLFDGSKSAEEVAEVTQNRVQLYLDER
ncbi:MAG TPA: hypothetical protein DCZ91_04550 [Lachnospiraceae bacterium]|nr:hypothetical protein [Lachnospiraceae bacterium]